MRLLRAPLVAWRPRRVMRSPVVLVLAERLRHKLLRAALEHVPRHGWSHAALVAGARDVGMSPAVAGERGR